MKSLLTFAAVAVLPLSQIRLVHAFPHGAEEDTTLPYNVQLQYCPQSCDLVGPDPVNWTSYHDTAELALCSNTILFSINVQNLVSSPETRVFIKACTASGGSQRMTRQNFLGPRQNVYDSESSDLSPAVVSHRITSREHSAMLRNLTIKNSCGAVAKSTSVDVQTGWSGRGIGSADEISAAATQLARYLKESAGCGPDIMFAYAGDAALGVFSGGDLTKASAGDLVQSSKGYVGSALPEHFLMQVCSSKAPITGPQFGLFADLSGNLSAVQDALRTWVNGGCVDAAGFAGGVQKAASVTMLVSPFEDSDNSGATSNTNVALARAPWSSSDSSHAEVRAECRDIQVVSLDSCASLATRCGISGADFTKYNSYKSDLCSTLKPKQYVCCSAGTLPDHSPKPNADGTCYSYKVQPGDGCWAIADSFGIDQSVIEKNNEQTWGWAGCGALGRDQVICLSKGDPPMPNPDPTAMCGPQVVGTKRPAKWSDVSNLNPCPLNVCCDMWGMCGTTNDFCDSARAATGAPGTAKEGGNGCISNCGTGIVNNGDKPERFAHVGYFEAWNSQRPCLHMDISQFDTGYYTHVHFAFATITTDFKVNISTVQDQFNKMKGMDMKGAKKIVSFGGWSFSTEYDSYPIFRNSVTPGNRETFADNVVQFLVDNKLDGLDFDWEYPGAPDIPGIPPGSPDDGDNYLAFLQMVRRRLPAGKTLSIALPASYWYLRGFPVAKMTEVVDYFIYMTYDLHGQWDYGNKWSNPGCPDGNCLRSHVNISETLTALAMLTKAGVKSKQIMVGVSSYGRSFKMADPKCTGDTCHFTGSYNDSNADPGDCTGTSGYISEAEIRGLIDLAADSDASDEIEQWYDKESSSDIMTWDGNWVAWMDTSTKGSRVKWIQELNFGGISDWAVDLQRYHAEAGQDDDPDQDADQPVMVCDADYADLDAVANDAPNIPGYCWAQYVIESLQDLLSSTIVSYNNVANDYDGKFGYYVQYINELVDPQLQDWMSQNPNASDKGEHTSKGNRFFSCKFRDLGAQNWAWEGTCPVPQDLLGPAYESWEIEFTLKDKPGFEAALLNELAMPANWIKWGTWDPGYKCGEAGGSGNGGDPCDKVFQRHINFPLKADSIKVANPKDIVTSALPNISALNDKMTAAYMSIGLGIYDGDELDAAKALAMPVSMLAQAVDSMATVKVIGGEAEDRKKKETILTIISVILMVVPLIAEIGFEVAGIAQLARFAFIAGEIGNGALTISDIIANPESAPFAIMGMLLGPAGSGLRMEKALAEAATARKAMSDANVEGMGKVFKANDDKVKKVVSQCIR